MPEDTIASLQEEGAEDVDALMPAGETAEQRSERMRALARRRWDKERAQAAGEDAGTDLARSNDDEDGRAKDAVLRELRKKARKGDVQAAKEYREWLRAFPEAEGKDAEDVAKLDPLTRSRLLETLLAAIAQQEGAANEAIREGTIDGFDAPPEGEGGLPADERVPISADRMGSLEGDTHTPPAASSAHEPLPPTGTAPLGGTHDSPQQMTVDECISDAMKEN